MKASTAAGGLFAGQLGYLLMLLAGWFVLPGLGANAVALQLGGWWALQVLVTGSLAFLAASGRARPLAVGLCSGSALDLLIDMVSEAHSSALITIPVHPAAVLSTLSSLLAYGVRLALIVLLVWLSRRRAFFAIPPLAGAFVLQLGHATFNFAANFWLIDPALLKHPLWLNGGKPLIALLTNLALVAGALGAWLSVRAEERAITP